MYHSNHPVIELSTLTEVTQPLRKRVGRGQPDYDFSAHNNSSIFSAHLLHYVWLETWNSEPLQCTLPLTLFNIDILVKNSPWITTQQICLER